MPHQRPAIDRRFAVLGCGSIGKRHLGNLRALGVRDLAGFDLRPDRRAEVAGRFGVEAFDSLDTLWAWQPQVALIAAPTSLHLDLSLAAARHGCHLFIEKPLADRLEGVGELLDEVRARGLVTLVGCNMRFHPGLRTVKRLVEEGTTGRVVAARIQVGQYLPDWHPWEDYRHGYSARRDLGGGVILDAIHEIDYARWLLGDVADVSCVAGKLSALEIDTEDTAALLLRFASGTIGEVHLDYVQRVYSRSCHVIGTEGTIRWDYPSGQTRWYTAATREWVAESIPAGWEPNQMYVDEMRHFVQCLDGHAASTLEVAQAARVLEIALAAKQSAAERRVVALTDGDTRW